MATELELKVARRAADLCREGAPGQILSVRVFGSRARDEPHPESDLDLFVLTKDDDRTTRYAVCDAAVDAMLEFGCPFWVSACVMGEARYRDLLERELLFALEVEREGIVVG